VNQTLPPPADRGEPRSRRHDGSCPDR